MNLVIKFVFELSSKIIAEKAVKSIQSDIESTSTFFERSMLKIEEKDNRIELEISASDISAAKASINSCLLWLENSINILEKYNIIKTN